MRKRSPGSICNRKGYYVWGFVDGECQTFMRGSCGTKIPGFASKEKCQRACGPKKIELKKGQDYKCPTGNPYDCKLDYGMEKQNKGKLFMIPWSFISIFRHSQQSRHFMTLFVILMRH